MDVFKRIATVLISLFAVIGVVFTLVWLGMNFGIFNVRGSIDERNAFFTQGAAAGASEYECDSHDCAWLTSSEWATVRAGLIKDVPVINRVARETGVPARVIAATVVPEQMRFFTSERELFKRVFEPLKILGSLSEFSLGVSGIKQETAAEIDRRRGEYVEPQLLYKQLTDPKDHYYSYLYTALFIKEIEAEWAQAGYPISNRVSILATLFNIGFINSKPNPSPQPGGSSITIGSNEYLYGNLAQTFYDSPELVAVFVK